MLAVRSYDDRNRREVPAKSGAFAIVHGHLFYPGQQLFHFFLCHFHQTFSFFTGFFRAGASGVGLSTSFSGTSPLMLAISPSSRYTPTLPETSTSSIQTWKSLASAMSSITVTELASSRLPSLMRMMRIFGFSAMPMATDTLICSAFDACPNG